MTLFLVLLVCPSSFSLFSGSSVARPQVYFRHSAEHQTNKNSITATMNMLYFPFTKNKTKKEITVYKYRYTRNKVMGVSAWLSTAIWIIIRLQVRGVNL